MSQAPQAPATAPGVVPPSNGNGRGMLPPGGYDLRPRDPWPPAPPGVPTDISSYLNYLPGIYSTDEFLGRFLLIFEHILNPVERSIDNIAHVFDPQLTPSQALPWLASWLGIVLDARWPEERRRQLVHEGAELYHWRGTKRGLSRVIELYTGVRPEISEPTLSQLAADRRLAYRFHVRLAVPKGAAFDESMVRLIIELEKPAFTAYTLELKEE